MAICIILLNVEYQKLPRCCCWLVATDFSFFFPFPSVPFLFSFRDTKTLQFDYPPDNFSIFFFFFPSSIFVPFVLHSFNTALNACEIIEEVKRRTRRWVSGLVGGWVEV